MKKIILAAPLAIAVSAFVASPGLAAVNCNMVNKHIEHGKKPEDVAELMGISIKEVKTCQEQNNTNPNPAAAKDTAPKGTKAPGMDTTTK